MEAIGAPSSGGGPIGPASSREPYQRGGAVVEPPGRLPLHLWLRSETTLAGGQGADGSLLVADASTVPARIERFDPRTRKTSFFAAVSSSDPAVTQIKQVRVTQDGQTIAFSARRVSGVLHILDWGGGQLP